MAVGARRKGDGPAEAATTAPVGVAVVAGAVALLPAHTPDAARPQLDVVGAVLGTAGLLGVVSGVMRSSALGWAAAEVWALLLAGVALLAVFLLHQGRWAREPLMPLELFAVRSVRSGNLVMFLLGLGFFATPVLLSLYLRDVLGYSPLLAGSGYLPVGVAMFAGAQAAGPLTVRLGPRRAAVSFMVIGVVGLTASAMALDHGGSLALIAGPGMVFGFGTAAAFTPLTVAATTGVPRGRAGLAAGVLNTVRQTSGAVGLAALAAVAAAVTGAATGDPRTALAHGYAAAFVGCAACLLGATVVAAVTMPRSV